MAETGVRGVFAASVARERKARGWSRTELARQAGLSPATIVYAEEGIRGPSLQTAALIAHALGMTLGALTDGEAGHG